MAEQFSAFPSQMKRDLIKKYTQEGSERRYCYKCTTFQPTDKGVDKSDAKGRPRWMCQGCMSRIQAAKRMANKM